MECIGVVMRDSGTQAADGDESSLRTLMFESKRITRRRSGYNQELIGMLIACFPKRRPQSVPYKTRSLCAEPCVHDRCIVVDHRDQRLNGVGFTLCDRWARIFLVHEVRSNAAREQASMIREEGLNSVQPPLIFVAITNEDASTGHCRPHHLWNSSRLKPRLAQQPCRHPRFGPRCFEHWCHLHKVLDAWSSKNKADVPLELGPAKMREMDRLNA